jgi:hypothetical protein
MANLLSSVRSPAQLKVRAALLAEFRGDKTLSLQRLDIRRQQAQPAQLVALGRTRLWLDRFVQVLRS